MKFVICLLGVCSFLGSSSVAFALSDENRPEYQKEYDAYLRDLSVIAQQGKAPANPDLEADLAKMSSNDKIMLTVPQKKASADLVLAQSEDAQIMNSVELIRVPEEFREDYHEVYKEEKKMISTQSLVESDQVRHKTIAENPKILDVADHVNPFRFLSEVPLSPLKKGKKVASQVSNPLVGAYFNQFGRTYAGGRSESEKQTSQTDSSKKTTKSNTTGSLGLRKSMIVD